MSDNINVIDGKASFFTVKEVAWHGLGKVLENCPTSEEAIKYAGLDFEVIKTPNFARVPFNSTNLIETPSSFSTYRTDSGIILGDKIGRNYNVVQNKLAFGFFDSIVGEGKAIFETAGALGKGEIIFITAKLPDYIRVKGDDIEKYLLLTSRHDGIGSIVAMFTPVRVVCANTLAAALSSNNQLKVNIRHTSSAEENLKLAANVLGITNKASNELQEIFIQMAKKSVADQTVKKYLSSVFMKSTDHLELSEITESIINDAEKYYYEGPGQQMDSCRGTAFGAYNAVTGYLNNVKEYKSIEAKMKYINLTEGVILSKKAFKLAEELI